MMQQDVSGDVCPLVADVQRVEPSFEFGGEARLIEDEGIGAVGSNPLGSAWIGGELWVPNIDSGTSR